MVTDLVDYLNNNLLISHYCGFDISVPLPSYWTFDRFPKHFDNEIFSQIMKSQVLLLTDKGIVDTSFIGLDFTPISVNASQNNPKSFFLTNIKRTISPKQILTVSLEYILLPIKPTRKNLNSTGATKIMSLWTVCLVLI